MVFSTLRVESVSRNRVLITANRFQCYAKCVGLSEEKEPDIFNAIKFGSVLENVVFNDETRIVDYDDTTLTENTRWYV